MEPNYTNNECVGGGELEMNHTRHCLDPFLAKTCEMGNDICLFVFVRVIMKLPNAYLWNFV